MLMAMEKPPANEVRAVCNKRAARAAAEEPPPRAKGKSLASPIRPAPDKQDGRTRRARPVPPGRELGPRPRANCRRLKARRPREHQGGTVCTAPRQHPVMGIDDGPAAPGRELRRRPRANGKWLEARRPREHPKRPEVPPRRGRDHHRQPQWPRVGSISKCENRAKAMI
jgi:hypothetical protein